MERWLLCFPISSILLLSACSAKVGSSASSTSSSSTLSISTPASLGKMGTLPSDRKICYAANVTGPGITTDSSNSCALPSGVISNFVDPGSTLEINVPNGQSRKVELFAFFLPAGDSSSCASLNVDLADSAKLKGMYKVGTASSVEVGSSRSVSLDVQFPGMNQNVAEQFSLPSTCPGVFVPLRNATGLDSSKEVSTVSGGGMDFTGGPGGVVTQ